MSDLVKQVIQPGASFPLFRSAGLLLVAEASAPVRVKIYAAGRVIFDAQGVGRGVKIRPENGFEKIDVINESAAEVSVELFVCSGDVDVQIATGITVTVDNAEANAIPVNVLGADLTATSVELANKPATAGGADVTADADGAWLVASASKDRKAIWVRNASENQVGLSSGAAASLAECVLLIEAGDSIIIDGSSACVRWKAFAAVNSALIVEEVSE